MVYVYIFTIYFLMFFFLVVDVPLYLFLFFFVFIFYQPFRPLLHLTVSDTMLPTNTTTAPLAKITPHYALSHPHGQKLAPCSNRTNVKSGVSALSSTSTAFGTAAANTRLDSHTNGIDESLKQQVLAEEEAAMNQYKVLNFYITEVILNK